MRALTKADIVNAITEDGALSKKINESKQIVEDMLALMKKGVVEDGSLLISGFGKFESYEKSPRRGRNPQTSESITLDGRRVVAFRLSRKFREELNGDAVTADD